MQGIRFIPTAVHGVLDYVVGIALLLAPMLFGFSDVGGAAVLIPRILGVGMIVYALVTDFELGVVKVLPMSAHLVIDFLGGAFLAVSPWLFGFADEEANAWMPHLVVGIALILVSLVSKTKTGSEE